VAIHGGDFEGGIKGGENSDNYISGEGPIGGDRSGGLGGRELGGTTHI